MYHVVASGVVIRDADLSKVRFGNSRLKEPDFTRSNLTDSDFTFARIGKGDFSETNIKNAKFTMAALQRASFTGANIADSDFRGADLRWAKLDHARILNTNSLEGATYSHRTDLPSEVIRRFESMVLEPLLEEVEKEGIIDHR